MPDIPAFCDKCGAIFRSGIFMRGGTATLVGNKAGPCPVCGSMGTIPDGVYRVVRNVIQLLAGHHSLEQLRRLTSVIEEARRMRDDPDEVIVRIKQDAPELNSVVDILPKTRRELYSFLTLILVAISVVISTLALKQKETSVKLDIENMVEVTIESAIKQSQPTNAQKPKKPGRNKPCPCGSGKKYKHCCGKKGVHKK